MNGEYQNPHTVGAAYFRWQPATPSPLKLELQTTQRIRKLKEVLQSIAIALLVIGAIGGCLAVSGTGIGTALYLY